MTLVTAKPNNKYIIKTINNDELRMQVLRFGFGEGSRVQCLHNLFSTVILKCGLQQIAIGKHNAEKIEVDLLEVNTHV